MATLGKNNTQAKFKREPIVLAATVKRLQRKSSKFVMETAKPINSGRIQIQEKKTFTVLDLTLEAQHRNFPQNNLPITSLRYLSPKSTKGKQMSEFSKAKPSEETFSTSDIEARTILRVPSSQNIALKKKPFSRTAKYSQNRKSLSRQGRTHFPIEQTQLEEELVSLKIENQEVNLENNKLKQRVNDLKEENQYMYKQMEKLNSLILGHKYENEELSQLNAQLCLKLDEYELDVGKYKQNWRVKANEIKRYEILEHVHWKVKDDYQNSLKLINNLQNKNQILQMKVSKMSKLSERNQKSKMKSKQKQKDNFCTQCKKSLKNEPVSLVRSINWMNSNNSRKSENFFQLSPE